MLPIACSKHIGNFDLPKSFLFPLIFRRRASQDKFDIPSYLWVRLTLPDNWGFFRTYRRIGNRIQSAGFTEKAKGTMMKSVGWKKHGQMPVQWKPLECFFTPAYSLGCFYLQTGRKMASYRVTSLISYCRKELNNTSALFVS